MNKLFCSFILVLLLFSIYSVFASGSEEGVDGKPVTLKLGHNGSETHNYHIWANEFKEIVEAESGGKILIEIYPSDTLGAQKELVEGAQLGTVDMVLTSDNMLSNFVPEIGVLNLPFLFKDYAHVYEVVNGPIGKQLEEKLAEKNLIVIGWWENGFKHFTNSKRPIYTPEDLKGLKMRVSSSKVFADSMNALGAIATPMSFSELYSSMQLGVVDGQSNPTTHIYHHKFFEVQDYLSLSGHFHVVEPLIMSKAVYNKIDSDTQAMLKRAGKMVSEQAFKDKEKNYQDELAKIKAEGMQVNEVDREAFIKAVQVVYEKYEPIFGKDIIDQLTK